MKRTPSRNTLPSRIYDEIRDFAPNSSKNLARPSPEKAPNCRNIAIALIDPDFGEQTAQACAIA
jgi:hypothetical protein